MKNKLTSRKFWMAIITIVAGILGAVGANDNIIQLVSSALLILIPAVIYIITEGKIDSNAVKQISLDKLLELIESLVYELDCEDEENIKEENTN